jgi:predicted DNA binding CopG/RHH family protein
MRTEYNFSKSTKNPYAKKLKKQITIRIEEDTINYFKGLSTKTGIPYQNLIDLYLSDCAQKHKKLSIKWDQ